MTEYTLKEFLKLLGTCDMGQAADIIESWQSGRLEVQGISIVDLD